MALDFTEGERKAVADYFSGVLAVQRYPSDFPTGVKVANLLPDRDPRIDIDLPLMTAISELESADYLTTKKELKYKKLNAAARNKLYQQVVAQMALRTLRCVFTRHLSPRARTTVPAHHRNASLHTYTSRAAIVRCRPRPPSPPPRWRGQGPC
jgi:hypothetical protein